MGTQRFRGPLQDCARVFPVKGARDALRNLEAGVGAIMGPDRLLSLAIHATTERRASDQPSPTASRIKGQKVMPALVHCEAVSRKAFFRDSTEVKMPEVDVGSGRVGPNLKALVMEKSHASGPPLGPRGTQTSAGRREAFARSGGSGSGGDHHQWGHGG